MDIVRMRVGRENGFAECMFDEPNCNDTRSKHWRWGISVRAMICFNMSYFSISELVLI